MIKQRDSKVRITALEKEFSEIRDMLRSTS